MSSNAQLLQLAIATPLVDAANDFGTHVNTFGTHVGSFGGYIKQLVEKGIRYEVVLNAPPGAAGSGMPPDSLRGVGA